MAAAILVCPYLQKRVLEAVIGCGGTAAANPPGLWPGWHEPRLTVAANPPDQLCCGPAGTTDPYACPNQASYPHASRSNPDQ